MKVEKVVMVFLMIVFSGVPAFCQKSEKKPKIKSITILEEKSDVLIKKQVKDSETFYDSRGNILEEINYKQGKVDKHFRYQYDNEDNKIKEEKIDPSGKVTEYSEYKYENGLRTEKIVYTGSGKIKSKKVYQYTTW
jgi:hypothetical protein